MQPKFNSRWVSFPSHLEIAYLLIAHCPMRLRTSERSNARRTIAESLVNYRQRKRLRSWRSELVGLDVDDVGFETAGIVLTSAAVEDQSGGRARGSRGALTAPTRSLSRAGAAGLARNRRDHRRAALPRGRSRRTHREWPSTARIVGERVKKIGARSGLDPGSYAAHSLRSGFATSAARANKSEAAIMRQGRWKSIPVARRYIRAGSRWHDHAGAGIGL